MSSLKNTLKPWNTFHLEASAASIEVATSNEALLQLWQESRRRGEPVLVLGEGSNVLFLEDFQGRIIINRIAGLQIAEYQSGWHLHIGAGENWHNLVKVLLEKDIPGLENLAMIPGCVGSAPIQNIGAYGVELKDVCEYVDVLHLPSGQTERLSAAECRFGYRESIFKHQYKQNYVVTGVGLTLNKPWKPVMTYGDLKTLDPETVTPRQIFDAVCAMRSSKLPDPAITGNAGSFFKNPVIDATQAATLRETYPTLPLYPQTEGKVKLAAGWLIEHCDLKGFAIGGAAVHQQQALVLINHAQATGSDIVALAHEVRQRVGSKFNVWLEPEVRFIGAQGEEDAVGVIS